ncbi:MAG: acyl-CoA dehydrogenase family protein [Syntrophales bacterium]|jgi:alkylation response protein AidB-like acyl-CoA dehydrogenase
MDLYQKKYGLFSDESDLLHNVPSLRKLKDRFPRYVARAERAQMLGRKIAREVILPKVLELDTKCHKDPSYVDWQLFEELNKRKALTGFVPEKMGGLGWSALDCFAFSEETMAACVGISAWYIFNLFGVACSFVEFNPGICVKVLQDMVHAQNAGKPLSFAWSITEPSAGTDAEDPIAMSMMKPSAFAKKVSGGYSINGRKQFITNGDLAHYVVATICTDPNRPAVESMGTFFIPTTTKGFSVERLEHKCGHKAKHTAALVFDDVFIPDEYVWEQPGRGMRHTREILSITRGAVGMLGLGNARGALERCVQFASQRRVNSHRLIDENWVQIAIADMLKDIMIIRAKCFDFAIALDRLHVFRILENVPAKVAMKLMPKSLLMSESLLSLVRKPWLSKTISNFKHSMVSDETMEYFAGQGSAVKVAGTDLAMNVSSRVLDIVGIEGMAYRYGMEKIFRDAKVSQIYEGTNQANKIDLYLKEIEEVIGS